MGVTKLRKIDVVIERKCMAVASSSNSRKKCQGIKLSIGFLSFQISLIFPFHSHSISFPLK
jgi:hypothetical protein